MIKKILVFAILFASCRNDKTQQLSDKNEIFRKVVCLSSVGIIALNLPDIEYSSSFLNIDDKDSLDLYRHENSYFFKDGTDTASLIITFKNGGEMQEIDTKGSSFQWLLNCENTVEKRQITISEKAATEYYCNQTSFFICHCPKGIIEIKLACKNEKVKNEIVNSIKLSCY